jgi:hypothetical protein
MHESIPLQGKWLGQVVRGCFAYHAVPANSRCLGTFRHYVVDLWRLTRAAKSARSHNVESDGNTRGRVLTVTAHPSSVAQRSFRPQTPEVGARCVNHARRDLCVGVRSNAHPNRDTVSDLQLALLPNSGHRELVRQTSSPVLIRQEIFMTHQDSRPRIGVSSALAARTGSKYSLRNAILPSAARRKTT